MIRLGLQHRDDDGLRTPAYVGDTAGDRDASRAAAFRFVYAAYGFGDLADEEPFTSFDALCAHLAELCGTFSAPPP